MLYVNTHCSDYFLYGWTYVQVNTLQSSGAWQLKYLLYRNGVQYSVVMVGLSLSRGNFKCGHNNNLCFFAKVFSIPFRGHVGLLLEQ